MLKPKRLRKLVYQNLTSECVAVSDFSLAPARASMPTACGLVVLNKRVADVAIVAGIGRRVPVFSFAALKAINTSNALHLRFIHSHAWVFLAVLHSQYSVLRFCHRVKNLLWPHVG